MKIKREYILTIDMSEATALRKVLGSLCDNDTKEMGLDNKQSKYLSDLYGLLPCGEDDDN